MSKCVSGWAMLNRQPAVIEDVFADDRIPVDVYKPTFVQSMLMVPIRSVQPIGAIGNYWAEKHLPNEQEVTLLQALADITAVSIENVMVYAELQQKLSERTQLLEYLTSQNRQLEDFCYIISHDLRAPLSNLLLLGNLVSKAKDLEQKDQYFARLKPVIDFLHENFDRLVDATQLRTDLPLSSEKVSVEEAFAKVIALLQAEVVESNASITGDFSECRQVLFSRKSLESVLFNLISNAIHYRSPLRSLQVKVKAYCDADTIISRSVTMGWESI
jgi:hypothetical protein